MSDLISKKQLRERILTLLKGQSPEERKQKSELIGNKLFNLEEIQRARTIMFYASFDGEVETIDMMIRAIKARKRIALPRIVRNQSQMVPALVSLLSHLEEGPFGIKQPSQKEQILNIEDLDAVIVPGIAFDRQNNRLGRGGGYYDLFLHSIPKRIPTIGLAFDFQIVDQLSPLEEHDIPVLHVLVN